METYDNQKHPRALRGLTDVELEERLRQAIARAHGDDEVAKPDPNKQTPEEFINAQGKTESISAHGDHSGDLHQANEGAVDGQAGNE